MDRRTFVRASVTAAASAIPLAASATAATIDRTEWESAITALRLVDEQIEAFDASHYAPVGAMMCEVRERLPSDPANWSPKQRAAYNAASAIYDPIEKQFDRLVSEQAAAIDDLLLCPAPDTHAVAFKLQITLREKVWERDGFEDICLQLIDDLAPGGLPALS